jgi:hypothetical protein
MPAEIATHIWLDNRGAAWIDQTNVKVVEVVLDKLAHEPLTMTITKLNSMRISSMERGHTRRFAQNPRPLLSRYVLRKPQNRLEWFAVASLYLFFTRWPSDCLTGFSDDGALVMSILAGAAFVVTLPIRPAWRILSLVIYIPVLGASLFFYALAFIAIFFQEGP